jgi:tRNA(fMet)-specific endonuclease VapC
MVCLDSDILIDFLKQKDYATKIINRLKESDDNLSTTSVNAFELFRGAIKSKDPEAVEPLKDLISYLKILNFNLNSSKKAAEIFEELKSKGETLDLADVMIASIVITNNETLITNNLNHFKRIPELKILS